MLVSADDSIYAAPVKDCPDYTGLTSALLQSAQVADAWMEGFVASPLRLPQTIDRASMSASVAPVVDAFATLVGQDRMGRDPVALRFLPGSPALREIEKAVSFVAANLGASGLTAFDVGALLFALRDVLCATLRDEALIELQAYMEWLAVLAADSLATGREQALIERMHLDLDEGTPLIMITSELPALLLVGRPDRSVVASVFGRLLLMVVRTGAKAVIIDVRGMSGRMSASLAEPLESFLDHKRVRGRLQVFVCGVRADDVVSWQTLARNSEVILVIEEHFDKCVRNALTVAGWRLIPVV